MFKCVAGDVGSGCDGGTGYEVKGRQEAADVCRHTMGGSLVGGTAGGHVGCREGAEATRQKLDGKQDVEDV